jgi:hypothetical protein
MAVTVGIISVVHPSHWLIGGLAAKIPTAL